MISFLVYLHIYSSGMNNKGLRTVCQQPTLRLRVCLCEYVCVCVCVGGGGGEGSVVLPIQMCEYCLVIPGYLLHVYIPAGCGVGSELAWVHSLRLPLYNHPITCRPLCPELTTESRAWQELGTVFMGNWGCLDWIQCHHSPWDWSIWFLLSQKLYALQNPWQLLLASWLSFSTMLPPSPRLILARGCFRWVLWGCSPDASQQLWLDPWLLKRTWTFHLKPLSFHPTSDLSAFPLFERILSSLGDLGPSQSSSAMGVCIFWSYSRDSGNCIWI